MDYYEPIPDAPIERAKLLESILLLACEYKKDPLYMAGRNIGWRTVNAIADSYQYFGDGRPDGQS